MKGRTVHKLPSRSASIVCNTCGNREFKRTLSETDSIVRLAYTKRGTAVKETIVSEGKIEFVYQCAKCGVPLLKT